MKDLRALLLCGGAATRFRSDKLLVPMTAGGEPLVARAARALREGAGAVLAVVPAGAHALREALERAGCEVLESDRTAQGMGATLAAAVAATDRADGWLVALGDMPLVRPATVRAVRSALEDGALLAAPMLRTTGARGHPVGFAGALRAELLALGGDRGARDIVERHRAQLRGVATDDEGIVVDIDTPEQLEALRGQIDFFTRAKQETGPV